MRILTRAGRGPWTKVGTGFFWANRLEGGGEFVAAITNKHVVDGQTALSMQLHLGRDDQAVVGPGREVVLEGATLCVIPHPDPEVDLVLIPMGPAINRLDWQPFLRALDWSMIPDPGEIEHLSSIQPVVVAGYPNGLSDTANNLPIVRQGVTAVAPWIDYQGRREIVCDVAVFGGSSGSPVFVIWDGRRELRGGGTISGKRRMILLGVLYAGHTLDARGEIVRQEPTGLDGLQVVTSQMIHLALCVKSSRVEELVIHGNAELGLKPIRDERKTSVTLSTASGPLSL